MNHSKVTPYGQESGEKKEQVGNMFDKIAPYYDFLNHFLSLGVDIWWRKKAISHLKAAKPQYILDVATGTADLAIEMSQQLNPTQIIGMDLSANMVEIGEKKLNKKGLDQKIKLEVGDSENLHYTTEQFDAVTASFGVRNFANLKIGLSEMHRVLKNDGQLMILEFSKPKMFPFKQLYNFYFKNILPLVGRFTSKDPKAYQYLYESVQAFPDYEKFEEVLRSVGFKDVKWKPLTLGICTIYTAIK